MMAAGKRLSEKRLLASPVASFRNVFMPYANLSQARLYYVIDGPQSAPALVLSNSLGTCADMWAQQVPAFSEKFRVLRYDTRGHGKSSTSDKPLTFQQLANDVAELMSFLNIEQAHFCGLSMGGPTGMVLALEYPELVNKLVLCNTAARIGTMAGWDARIAAVRENGLESLAMTLVERWLSDSYRAANPGMTQTLVDMLRRTPEAGYIANCMALRDADLRERIHAIQAPTLVISGAYDPAATTQEGRFLADTIPAASHVELEASHISNWEQPQAFTSAVLNFL
jgi:3-oxoadipate enol-lactonase